MNHIDITFDLETCATTANAAVMQVAAVAWNRYAKEDPFVLLDENEPEGGRRSFEGHVDLRSCVVDGFDFDKATVQWWARQSDTAKRAVTKGLAEPIEEVFLAFVDWIRRIMEEFQADSVCLWCQGMDFDGAILRNICDKYDIELPFRYQQFRDCRTVILETAIKRCKRLYDAGSWAVRPEEILQKPCKAYDKDYNFYQPLPDEYGDKDRVHDAMFDCIRSTWNVWQALNMD